MAPLALVVACDKFKGSLDARQVAEHIVSGVARVAPGVATRVALVSDGGDGALDAACAAGFERVPVTVTGPTGRPVATSYAARGSTAVIELADACGLLRLPGGRPAPLTASSRGLGEVLAAALDAGLTDIVLAVGGSASTDGGAGMLTALGARLTDAAGRPLPDGGGALADLDALDLGGLHPALATAKIILASDVTNPLLGTLGAVEVFSAQKGADDGDRVILRAGLARWAEVVTATTGRDDRDRPGAGAAGGVGYAAQAVLGAVMRPGIDVMLRLVGFESLLAGAGLVVTGEGSLDRQTLLGKAPAGVARAAGAAGVPVVAVCGRSLLSREEAAGLGVRAVYALSDLEPDPARCMREAAPLLERLAERVARDWLG